MRRRLFCRQQLTAIHSREGLANMLRIVGMGDVKDGLAWFAEALGIEPGSENSEAMNLRA